MSQDPVDSEDRDQLVTPGGASSRAPDALLACAAARLRGAGEALRRLNARLQLELHLHAASVASVEAPRPASPEEQPGGEGVSVGGVP